MNPATTHPAFDVLPEITKILSQFLPQAQVTEVRPLGTGNINDTYLVLFSQRPAMVLQKINAAVFPDPRAVAENVGRVVQHLHRKQPVLEGGRPNLQAASGLEGKPFVCAVDGSIWRLLSYLENCRSYRVVQTAGQAFEGGRMLGRFHRLLDDFDPGKLRTPLPDFHNLPLYCRRFQQAVSQHRRSLSVDLTYCLRQAANRLGAAALLEEAGRRGRLGRRVIHGDPKCDNILFDRDSERGVALIDLDTVAGGLLQYDLGDCLRSFCNLAGEQPAAPEEVLFDTDICREVLAGYLAAGAGLPPGERDWLFQGVRLLTYELAIRFLTDYLEGDRYFKVADEQENLRRALSQFQLLDSIEKQERLIVLAAAACLP